MATATISTTATESTWQDNGIERRSVELARQHGVDALDTHAGAHVGTRVYWYVYSRTRRGVRYAIRYDAATDRVESCDCPARGGCWHRGAVRMAIEARKAWERLPVFPQPEMVVCERCLKVREDCVNQTPAHETEVADINVCPDCLAELREEADAEALAAMFEAAEGHERISSLARYLSSGTAARVMLGFA